LFKSLKNIWSVLDAPEKRKFRILTGLDILISILDIASLALLLWIIRFYIEPGEAATEVLPHWLADKESTAFIALFLVLFSIKNIAAYFVTRSQYDLSSRVAVRISANNLARYQHAPFAEFIQTDSSIQVRKIGFQPFEFCQYMLSGIQQVFTQGFLITLTILAILIFNAQVFLLLLLILLPPVALVFYIIKKRLAAARSKIRSSNERSFQYMMDALKGYVESNIYNRNPFFLDRFIHHRTQFSKHLFNSLSIQSLPSRIIEVFAVLGLFILIAIAKWTGDNNGSTLVTIGAFMAAAYKIIPGMVKLINITGQMKAYEFSVGDLSTETGIQKNQLSREGSEVVSIEFDHVGFHYNDTSVLEDLSFNLKSGDFVGISGRSGRGKTTILNLLLGFLEPHTGTIRINGSIVNSVSASSFWPMISYVRQQPFFIYDSVLKNITLEENRYDPGKLDSALKVSGLHEWLSQYPEGMEKPVTENGKNISGGQQQRICIARALYKNANLILLDEPFNELDAASEKKLIEHFAALASQGNIVIMITHHQQSLDLCNKIISLDE
jgi:ABC-type multidrug transport system fused ATPase/permease subunit